jgi:excisionase family DNA binding protein
MPTAETTEIRREWLSYPDAERYSGLSSVTLWRAIKSGELEAAHIGRAVRISRSALEAFMRARVAKQRGIKM